MKDMVTALQNRKLKSRNKAVTFRYNADNRNEFRLSRS